jgi:hypothetical protein
MYLHNSMLCSYFLFLEFFNVQYVGVIRFAHHVIRLLPIILTQQNCSSNSTIKHLQKLDRKLNLSEISFGYQKCMFVDVFSGYNKSSKLCS